MTKILTEAAAAMAKARHAKQTPAERSQSAARMAAARWKGNGLTWDQKRILRKLVSQEEAFVTVSITRSKRIGQALVDLESAGLIRWSGSGVNGSRVSRGPKWRADLVK